MGTSSTQHKIVPKLRFSEFKELWSSAPLGELFSFLSGGTPSMADQKYWNGNIPWVTAASMRGNYFSATENKVTEAAIGNGTRLVPEGTILLLVRGSMLYKDIPVGITKVIASFNQDVKALIPKKDVNTEFYLYWFLHKKTFIMSMVTGTGIGAGKLDTEELKAMRAPVIDEVEQQKIADFLGSVDAWLENLRRQKNTLETYKRGMLQKLFTQKIRFKDDDGKDFPAWKVKELSKIANVKKGQQLGKEEMIGTGKVPVINGGVNASGFTDKANTKKDTITISEGGNSCGFVSYMTEDFWCGGHCYSVLVDDNSDTVKSYLFSYLKYKQTEIMKLRVGSGLPNIQKRDIDTFAILHPDKREQQKIADFLATLDESVTAKTKEITKIELWKKGLMQKMFV